MSRHALQPGGARAAAASFATGVAGIAVAAALVAGAATSATRAAGSTCSPATTILQSPRARTMEVQAKALNDRGDVVGFADSGAGTPIHAILWPGGKTAGAIDLGVLPGYVSSEAYGVNDERVVFGLLYDERERMFPFRWANGRMTVLKGPGGGVLEVAGITDEGRNAINERGEMVATLKVGGNARAVRWTRDGRATLLPRLPGHAWSWAFSINDDGVVSGWSRRQPDPHAEENPVIWTRSGTVVPLKTAPDRADGVADATNRRGLTVGLLGTTTGAETNQAAVWRTRTAAPLLLGKPDPYAVSGLVDVNERGQAAGMSGTYTRTGFPVVSPVIWRTGWRSLRPIRIPVASRVNPVLVTNLNDINNAGTIVGNVFGLAGKDYSKVRRVDPVLWTCQFGS